MSKKIMKSAIRSASYPYTVIFCTGLDNETTSFFRTKKEAEKWCADFYRDLHLNDEDTYWPESMEIVKIVSTVTSKRGDSRLVLTDA